MSGHDGSGTAAGEQDGATAGTDQAPAAKPRLRGPFLRDFLLLVGLAVLFTVPAKAFVTQAFLVPTGSMADTLRPGDKVLVNKLVYHFGGVHRHRVMGAGAATSGQPAGPLVP
jgi:signal peptidase I